MFAIKQRNLKLNIENKDGLHLETFQQSKLEWQARPRVLLLLLCCGTWLWWWFMADEGWCGWVDGCRWIMVKDGMIIDAAETCIYRLGRGPIVDSWAPSGTILDGVKVPPSIYSRALGEVLRTPLNDHACSTWHAIWFGCRHNQIL